MKSREIRQLFLEFFKRHDHKVIPSSPLIPLDDPTILFTNAGMVQFKSVFIGEETRPYKRAVSIQKCLRAGGKHNDLESVGRTARHHTFFEMLGNFSFGDYFKREAIRWAWEFLTGWLRLPKDRLLVSVYEDDDEAASLWKEETDVGEDRIFRLGEKDNFWQMGDTGPCGPCSEILIDQGPEMGCGRPDCGVGCDCDRFLEIWNLVFMQYNRDTSGRLTPLPKPSIDTGMGLERLSAIIQGKKNNFDSDLFSNIIKAIEGISGKGYGLRHDIDTSIRVIADHIRAMAFVLSEGLMPSNEGRGYVLRRIIRRAGRHGFMLGIDGPFLYKLLDTVIDEMSVPYPELLDNPERSKKILMFEEERFSHTLSIGMEMLNGLINEIRSRGEETIPGSELFRLYDTYGFPLDLVMDIAQDSGLKIDEDGFNREMEAQRRRARASWVGEGVVSGIYREILKRVGPTDFIGYEYMEGSATIVTLIRDGEEVNEVEDGEEIEIVLDRTPFYGEAGGQVGDTGWLKADGIRVEVTDTKRFDELIVHRCHVRKGVIKTGIALMASVDRDRRRAIMRNHTATHLLHTALRTVLGDHVKQSGSLVAPDRLRFDFTHFYPVSEKELLEIEEIVNERILDDLPVKTTITTIDEALSSGVIALFGEKYGEMVRVVRAGEFSAELCGGTHCRSTGEIGLFKILSEGSVAAGMRRIEALTGTSAIEYMRKRDAELKRLSALLKVDEDRIYERVERLINEVRLKEKEIERLRGLSLKREINTLLNDIIEVNNIKVLARRFDGLDMKSLRNLADTLRERIVSGVIVLGSILDSQVYYVATVTNDLTNILNAGDILRRITGGKGGGRPDMAQGGSKDIEGVDRAISSVIDIIKGQEIGSRK
ncbi:MAG: alanine--tRNA ligase [Thermodesulfovibrionia bacterium]